MPSNNLKPQLQKYSYDSLMTEALLEKQEGLIRLGEQRTWDHVLQYLETSIKPMFDYEPDIKTVDIIIHELKEERNAKTKN